LARRYAPLVALIVVQLLIIGLEPSKSGRQASQAAGEGGEGKIAGPAAAAAASPGAALAPGAGLGPTEGGSSGSSGALAPGVSSAGDTSHCVRGREFDPAIAYWAPPCVPGTPGGPDPNNGGQTYQGVTKDTITVVDYVANLGAEVNAIYQAEGGLVTYQDIVVLDKAWEKFINDHYVLYGRRLHIITYQGQCQSVPPDQPCLIAEMDTIVATYHPLGVKWDLTLCSACLVELARLKVVALGGIGFSDGLAERLAPYFYESGESATRTEEAWAEWWCAQMSSVNVPSRRVRYAGRQNPAQDLNGRPRVLGVIAANDPDNKDSVMNYLVPQLQQRCGEKVTHFYFYNEDANTAVIQAQAGIAAMDTTSNPATTVLCVMCDPAAFSFVLNGESNNNYHPENLLSVGIDFVGQAYTPPAGSGPSLACTSPGTGCEYDLALGVDPGGAEEPQSNDAGLRIFRLGGGNRLPGTPAGASGAAEEFGMLANLMENTGPDLTPSTMAARAGALGRVGGPGTNQPLLSFPHGSGYWTQDARLVYWDKHRPSPYNGRPGTYVQVGGRITPGAWPVRPEGPDVPVQRG
jgi:hypothetical protein